MQNCDNFPGLLQCFFSQRLMAQRQASPHTIAAYRDTFRLLLQFAQKRLHKAPSQLGLEDLDVSLIGAFLDDLENHRHNGARSRNLRLTAVRSFFRYAALESPPHAGIIQRVLAIPNQRQPRALVAFLTGPEIDALLTAPNQQIWLGRRDHAFLLTAVQTGLRLSEMTALRHQDIWLDTGPHVRCVGKGRKERCTPLAKSTVAVLKAWIREQGGEDGKTLFPSIRGAGPLSAVGVQHMLARHVAAARKTCPTLREKRISPHVLRHYVPCLTMSRNGEPLRILAGEISSPPAKPADMTRHSFLLAADSSRKRGVSPRIYRDSVVHAARMFSPKLFASWQSSLSNEFVGSLRVRDQATKAVEPGRESNPGCIPARAGILQTARYAPQGRPLRLAPELFGSQTCRSRWACLHRHGAVGVSQYYVVACFIHWPEILGQRAITRHSQAGYIVAQFGCDTNG